MTITSLRSLTADNEGTTACLPAPEGRQAGDRSEYAGEVERAVEQAAGDSRQGDVGRIGGVERAGGEADAPGLVSSTTSDPHQWQTLKRRAFRGDIALPDPRVQRMGRCRKSILNAARLIGRDYQAQKHRYKVAFLTLTYRDIDGWAARDISAFLHRVRQWLSRRGVPLVGLWKLEMQKRGAAHYHLLLWLPRGVTLPKPDKQGWWPHGMTNCKWARNPYGYVAKYLSKDDLGMIPKGARLYGLLGMETPWKREIRWWNVPSWVRQEMGLEHDPRRVPGGGWVSTLSGEVIRSRWHYGGIVWADGVRRVLLVKSDDIERGHLDQDGAAARAAEIEFWESAGRMLRYESDRIQWIMEIERMGYVAREAEI